MGRKLKEDPFFTNYTHQSKQQCYSISTNECNVPQLTASIDEFSLTVNGEATYNFPYALKGLIVIDSSFKVSSYLSYAVIIFLIVCSVSVHRWKNHYGRILILNSDDYPTDSKGT